MATAGGIVSLPPPPPSSADIVSANVALRRARAEERKLELLAKARSARIAWVLDDDDDANGDGDDDDDDDDDGVDLLSGLRACRPDALPHAPLVVGALLAPRPSPAAAARRRRRGAGTATTGRDDGDDGNDDGATAMAVVIPRNNRAVRRALEERGLEWGSVSARGVDGVDDDGGGVPSPPPPTSTERDPIVTHDVIPRPDDYESFLDAMCDPSAADVVLSAMKFCSTMREAANVVASTDAVGGVGEDDAVVLTGLSRAIRGFVGRMTRTVEGHEAFRDFVSRDETSDRRSTSTSSNEAFAVAVAAKERPAASIEKFVYGKCRRDIDAVLSRSTRKEGGAGDYADDGVRRSSLKTLGETDAEFHERVRSLQFVSPAHLEIRCLMMGSGGTGEGGAAPPLYEDVDLSYAVRQIRSIHGRSSPREMLQSILMAHRGVSFALNEKCGSGGSVSPPGADDVLPALILATLRAQAPRLPSALVFIEIFAPPSMLQGEAGYAYTSLCGAVQFLKELDMEGHLRGVALLGGAGEMSAVLSIGPDDFRVGLEECRRKMMLEVEEGVRRSMRIRSDDGMDECADETDVEDDTNDDGRIDDDSSLQIRITARQVRDARSHGEIVDLDWALKKQQEALWQRGEVVDLMSERVTNQAEDMAAARRRHQRLNLPPEALILPPHFSRSYSFLNANPDNIGIRDLPQLLNEYKMLVHVTELLLNERSIWRESERKRQSRLEREHLERDFADVIGVDEDGSGGELANGH